MKTKICFVFVVLTICLGRWTALADDKAPEATIYQIRNLKYGDLLRPKDANSANGTPIVLYPAQPWKCMTWRLQPSGNSAFHLKNLFTSKTFCANTDSNTPRQDVTQLLFPKEGGDVPEWQFMRLDDGSYRIADAKSSKVLTAVKEESQNEPKIVTAAWQNLDEQKWRLEKIDPKDLTM
jgi:hypothetical protein